jgi:hypothetical protein
MDLFGGLLLVNFFSVVVKLELKGEPKSCETIPLTQNFPFSTNGGDV